MARPTTARAEPALLETAPLGGGGVPVAVPDGPTGVLDPEGREEVLLAGGFGEPVPVPVLLQLVVPAQ